MSGVVGFYGKLPGAGDFVRRRLPPDFVDAWDQHFQRAVHSARRETGEHWASAWQRAPAWRFVLPAHVCGNGAWCGLMGPAVDRLGRAFPMVLAAPWTRDATPLFSHAGWFDALERVYRNAQREAVSVETFDARVAALPRPLAGAREPAAVWRDLPWHNGQWELNSREGARADFLLAETWRQIGMRPGPWCLWWTADAARVVATRGLPGSYAALLDRSCRDSAGGAAIEEAGGAQSASPSPLPLPNVAASDVRGDGEPRDAFEGWIDSEAARERDAGEALAASPFAVEHVATSVARTSTIGGLHERLNTIDSYDTDSAVLWLHHGRTLLVTADDGPGNGRRVAARAIRETVAQCGLGATNFKDQLTALHMLVQAQLQAQLSNEPRNVANANVEHVQPASEGANENAAAVVVRFEHGIANVLRVGAAAVWHWRRGVLRAVFVERTAGVGGELDDLLFGDAWRDMPGIGTDGDVDCDEAVVRVLQGDRLAILVTRELARLPREFVAQALDLPDCDDARAHLAARAGLGLLPAPIVAVAPVAPVDQWPLAVVDIGA